MIGQFVKGRIYVFIDAANILYAQRTLGWRISYEKLIKYFKRECNLGKAIVFSGRFSQDPGQQKFLDMLEINGYEVRIKEVKRIKLSKDHYKWKSNLDVELSLEMVEMIPEYETAVLLSGDNDFAGALDRVKRAGRWVIVVSTRGHIAKELLDRAKFIDLRKLRSQISQGEEEKTE